MIQHSCVSYRGYTSLLPCWLTSVTHLCPRKLPWHNMLLPRITRILTTQCTSRSMTQSSRRHVFAALTRETTAHGNRSTNAAAGQPRFIVCSGLRYPVGQALLVNSVRTREVTQAPLRDIFVIRAAMMDAALNKRRVQERCKN